MVSASIRQLPFRPNCVRQKSRVLQNRRMQSRAINSLALAAWSLWMIGAFGFFTLGTRLWTKLEGVVISSRDIPPTRGARYTTEYTLRGPDGQEQRYTAGPADDSLPRSLPVGTSLKKQRWNLDYQRDGLRVNDFGLTFYLVVLTIGFGCLGWSVVLWRRQRQ
jgi:hypothetical protein